MSLTETACLQRLHIHVLITWQWQSNPSNTQTLGIAAKLMICADEAGLLFASYPADSTSDRSEFGACYNLKLM